MGRNKVADLTCESSTLDSVNPTLWTRGGLEGIQIRINSRCVNLPREIILSLVAEEVRMHQVSRWESMEDSEVIKMLYDGS